jgi:hypothetical protein
MVGISDWFCLVGCLLLVLVGLVILALLVAFLILLGRFLLLLLLLLLFLLVFLLYALDLFLELALLAGFDGGVVDLGRAEAGVLEVGGADVEPVLRVVRPGSESDARGG